MKKNSVIIFDIDGTVVDSPSQKLPTKRLVEAFRIAEKINYLCAATGRPWTFAKEIIQLLTMDPSIVAGGTQIRSANGKVLWQCSIDESALASCLQILNDYNNHSLLFNDYPESDYLEDRGIKADKVPTKEKIYFLEAIFVPENIAYEIKEKINQIDGVVCTLVVSQRLDTKDLHITNEFATKEYAITELLKIIQVDVDKTTGVGDGHNDMHLFAAVKNKIAMGNAVSELKEASDLVIKDVGSDGLAEYLESL